MTRALLAACTALTLATGAQAAPLVHDSIGEFTSITAIQGTQRSGAPVAPGRSNLANMFDGNATTTFFSLGLGGTLTLVISPASNRIIDGFTVERTNLPGNTHPEAVEVFLGVNGAGFVLLGELRNSHRGGGADVINAALSPATLAFTIAEGLGDTARSLFSITNVTGDFNTIRFVDKSSGTDRSNDGFDIAELRLTSDRLGGPDPTLVPTPMALGLFGLGLAGLMAARRRKA